MREITIVALVALYFVILLSGTLFIVQFTTQTYKDQALTQMWASNRSYPPWTQPSTNVTTKYIPLAYDDKPLYQGSYKPNVHIVNVTAQDYHYSTGGSLQIDSTLNNTGDGTAYELRLRIVAMSTEGKVIDASTEAGRITPHMNLGISRQLNYNGSALVNCNVTLYYLDLVDAQNRPRP